MDVGRQLFEMKLADLDRRFKIRGWEGLFVFPPEQMAAEYAFQGRDAEPQWEVFMEKRGEPDSRHPERTGAPVRAAVRLNDSDAAKITVEELAHRLAAAVAGRAAHEALEWTRLDQQLLIEPHDRQQIGPMTDLISAYLKNV